MFKATMSMAVLSSGGTVLSGPTRSQEALVSYSTMQQRSRRERIQRREWAWIWGLSLFSKEGRKTKADK